MFGAYRGVSFDENASLGILQHLDKDELQRLMDDDTKLQDLITDLQQVKNLEVEKENLITSNKSLADYNLSREPNLTAGKGQLAELYEQAVTIQKQFEENKQKLDYICAGQSLDTTLALLQTETAKAEEEAEDVAENFMGGELEVDDFLSKYIELRKLGHLRKVKSEKMSELIHERAASQHAAAAHSSYNAPPASNHWGNSGNGRRYGSADPGAYLHR